MKVYCVDYGCDYIKGVQYLKKTFPLFRLTIKDQTTVCRFLCSAQCSNEKFSLSLCILETVKAIQTAGGFQFYNTRKKVQEA